MSKYVRISLTIGTITAINYPRNIIKYPHSGRTNSNKLFALWNLGINIIIKFSLKPRYHNYGNYKLEVVRIIQFITQ